MAPIDKGKRTLQVHTADSVQVAAHCLHDGVHGAEDVGSGDRPVQLPPGSLGRVVFRVVSGKKVKTDPTANRGLDCPGPTAIVGRVAVDSWDCGRPKAGSRLSGPLAGLLITEGCHDRQDIRQPSVFGDGPGFRRPNASLDDLGSWVVSNLSPRPTFGRDWRSLLRHGRIWIGRERPR
jgi:hypothetical protein